MKVAYQKMHGTGNRILVVDQRQGALTPPAPDRIRELGNDATGPGFDQLMWISPADGAEFVAAYRVFNADGSEVEQCGNGVRCVAWLLSGGQGGDLRLQSPSGPVEARVSDAGSISVSMGTPRFDPAEVPFVAESAQALYQLDVNGTIHDVAVLSMGNPHCVLQVSDVDAAPVPSLGAAIEYHERFPERCNVGFMHVQDRHHIDLRVHERGVGETAACGTGASAAVVAGRQLGVLDDDVTVQLPGGQVVVSWPGGTDPVWLTGNAELISEGHFDL